MPKEINCTCFVGAGSSEIAARMHVVDVRAEAVSHEAKDECEM
jgi:hypothetical protein